MEKIRTTKTEQTRNFIIVKTAPVFNRKGYAGTSMSDLTQATGLSKGSIYGNFRNKDEVALAVFDHNFSKVAGTIRKKIRERNCTIEKLMVYPELYRDFLRSPLIIGGCPLLNTATEADDTHPKLRKKVREALEVWRTAVLALLMQGIHRGEIRPCTDPSRFASVLIALIEGAVMQAKVTGSNQVLDECMDELEEQIRKLKT